MAVLSGEVRGEPAAGGPRHCYGYDDAGNQLTHHTTTSAGNCATASTMMRTMTYEVGHRPETISGGASHNWQKLLFRYDGSGDRYIQRQYGSSSPTQDSKITLYPFAGYEVELQRSGLTWSFKEGRQMLGDWGLWRASVTLPQGERIWRHGDRLGSPVAKSDETGVNLERHGFDAWGAARQGNGTPRPQGRLESAYSPRGFTGHEHLDAVGGVIHMNGRGYDANLGRFLSVDPIIQFPANSQSFNPYSYILNNPMSGTDPTGYCVTGTRIGSVDCKDIDVETVHVNSPQMAGGGGNNGKSNGGSSANGSPDTHSRQSTASKNSPQTTGKVSTNQVQDSKEESDFDFNWAPPRWEGAPNQYYPEPEIGENKRSGFWARRIDIKEDGDKVFISIEVGVRAVDNKSRRLRSEVISGIRDSLNGSHKFDDKIITLWVHLYPSNSRRNSFELSYNPQLQYAGLAQIGGRSIEIGPRTRVGTYGHEFLHLIGFTHLPNWTGGLRSYAPNRTITPAEVYDIYEMYR